MGQPYHGPAPLRKPSSRVDAREWALTLGWALLDGTRVRRWT